MKRTFIKVIIMIIVLTSITSCTTLRHVMVAEHASHDTLYVNTIKHDSVYIDRWHEVEVRHSTASHDSDEANDTVIIREKEREYHYCFLHDTIREVSIDTIPIVQQVEVVKTIKSVPDIYKWALAILIMLLILIPIYVICKTRF